MKTKQTGPKSRRGGPARDARQKILIVDDHPLTRHGMAQWIALQKEWVVCGQAADADAALAALRAHPDLVLVDLSLPGMQGLELIQQIRAREPGALVLVVSMHDELIYAQRALRAGARGYLMKSAGGEKLLHAMREVLAGRVYLSDTVSAQAIDLFSGKSAHAEQSPLSVLTEREFEVFEFIAQGLTTREMAKRLQLSPKTIETHRLHIREKLGLSSGPELIQFAVRWTSAQE